MKKGKTMIDDPDEPPLQVFTCQLCGIPWTNENYKEVHAPGMCFDLAFAQRSGRMTNRIDALERKLGKELETVVNKHAELARAEGRITLLERLLKEQLAEFTRTVDANAQKVGESLQLKIQYGALKAEHAKCASTVNAERVQELETLLARERLNNGKLHAERNALREEVSALRECVDEIGDADPANDEESDDEEEVFTLDDIRDVVRDELRDGLRKWRPR